MILKILILLLPTNRFSQESSMSQNVVVLVGRILLSIMFITAGFG